ncbi:MAG: sensor histidine kinase [Cyanobacteria bacterium SZAS-4]|nr:sensor histidine kinase [Cyanobacteria bacterium SZAS-4]
MKRPYRNSIQQELLGWLLVPICALWLVTTFSAYTFADRFANDAYDEIMLNSADSIVARILKTSSGVVVDLPPAARDILEHNDMDTFYYRVVTLGGQQLSADADLLMPPEAVNLPLWKPKFTDGTVKGKRVRLCVLKVPVQGSSTDEVVVIVAETLKARNHFATEITLSIVVPQLFFILLSAIAVSVGVSRALVPLKNLRNSLKNRSQYDLTPIAEEGTPTEVQPLVMAINELMIKLAEDLEAQRRFVGNAAHQLRTPLAGLKTYVALLKRKKQPETTDLLDQLDVGMDRLNKLVGGLLALAKAEPSANRSTDLVAVDLNGIACDITKALATKAEGKEVEVELATSDQAAIIQGDTTRLQDLISNLIDNAIVYTQKGGHIKIRVISDDQVRLVIEDNGPGIPAEDRDRVFERFYRVLGTGVEGSGLGLSIVKEIVIMHDAKISIEGVEPTGTRFIVTFKRSPPTGNHKAVVNVQNV